MGKIVQEVTSFVRDVVSDIGRGLSKAVDAVAEIAKGVIDISMTATGLKWIDEKLTGGLIYHTITGVIDNVSGMIGGLVTFDWVKFRDSAMGLINTAVAAAAIVVGAVTGNGYLIAAGVIMLDAQYNNGKLLYHTIMTVGLLEKVIFGTDYIEQYAQVIQALITMAATFYAGYSSGPYLLDWTGIAQALNEWKSVVALVQGGMSLYQIYSAITGILASQAYWEAQLKAAEEYYSKLISDAQKAKEEWFTVMTNPDLIQRIMPGGDLFLTGAGDDLWSMTSVAEPRYALGLIDRSDTEMDKLINNRFYSAMPGEDIYKPN